MSDFIAFCVPTFDPNPDPGNERRMYPSVNHLTETNGRGGTKTPEYRYLFGAVQKAAWNAMDAAGWWTADYLVDVYWYRYVTARRPFDVWNCGKAEADAMEPDDKTGFPGVYVNDNLVVPHPQPPQYDPGFGAVDRIVIVCVRRGYPIVVPLLDRPAPRPRRVAVAQESATTDVTVERVRSLAEIRSGETVSFAERDSILATVLPKRKDDETKKHRG